MPLAMQVEIRHPQGLEDLWAPRIVCDVCDKLIEDARQGNFLWGTSAEDYNKSDTPIVFAHKKCTHAAQSVKREADSSEYARSLFSMCLELCDFPLYLAWHLNLSPESLRECADEIGRNK